MLSDGKSMRSRSNHQTQLEALSGLNNPSARSDGNVPRRDLSDGFLSVLPDRSSIALIETAGCRANPSHDTRQRCLGGGQKALDEPIGRGQYYNQRCRKGAYHWQSHAEKIVDPRTRSFDGPNQKSPAGGCSNDYANNYKSKDTGNGMNTLSARLFHLHLCKSPLEKPKFLSFRPCYVKLNHNIHTP